MTNSIFKTKIYELTKLIPRGKVATYGQLAALAGHPHSARAVGVFMKTNPNAPQTPCHRVVASDGGLTGYSAGGLSVKKSMLLKEGVKFKGTKVDLNFSLWHPLV
jgi:O-6-methylguanine DNA methyltransferase